MKKHDFLFDRNAPATLLMGQRLLFGRLQVAKVSLVKRDPRTYLATESSMKILRRHPKSCLVLKTVVGLKTINQKDIGERFHIGHRLVSFFIVQADTWRDANDKELAAYQKRCDKRAAYGRRYYAKRAAHHLKQVEAYKRSAAFYEKKYEDAMVQHNSFVK